MHYIILNNSIIINLFWFFLFILNFGSYSLPYFSTLTKHGLLAKTDIEKLNTDTGEEKKSQFLTIFYIFLLKYKCYTVIHQSSSK